MTLLSIANSVADETKGPRPETIASNTDPAAQNILRLINKVGKRLQKAYAWNIITKEGTVTAPGVETLIASAALPSDFDRIIPETFWDRGSNNLISGPISAVEWPGLRVQTYSSQNKDHFDLLVKSDEMSADVLVSADIFAQNTRHFTGDPKASRASYGGDF